MTVPYGWAKRPMLQRVEQLQQHIPITIIYGSRSSVDSSSGGAIRALRPRSHVEITVGRPVASPPTSCLSVTVQHFRSVAIFAKCFNDEY